MVQELPLPEDERARVMDIFQELLALTPALYCSLPQQIVHRDFDGGNTLMEGSRVTGVLDFEFACPDLRAMDFAYALYSFTSWAWDTESGEELIRAFVTGFRESIILTPAEIEAVPDLMRLYRVVTLIHRAGRHRQGLAREEAVLIRVKSLLQLDRSLRERREVLLSVIYDAAA
jgi:homoserine kinase type II